jgi:hypothetical protein
MAGSDSLREGADTSLVLANVVRLAPQLVHVITQETDLLPISLTMLT